MSRCLGLPTVDVRFVQIETMMFDIVGSALAGPRNGNGQSSAIQLAGGGHVIGGLSLWSTDAEHHEYQNWLAARLNDSVRYINVPILTDALGLFPVVNGVPQPFITGIPFSDGAMFSDGAGFSQESVFGTIQSAAALNAGEIVINVVGAQRPIRWSEWFSIYHAGGKGWRAYRNWNRSDPVSVTINDGGTEYSAQRYTLAITPPLREATAAGARVRFALPQFCAMLEPGSTIPWEVTPPFHSSVYVPFVEAF